MAQGSSNGVTVQVTVPRTAHHSASIPLPTRQHTTSHQGTGSLPFTGAPIDSITGAALILIVSGTAIVSVIRRKGQPR